MIGLILTICRNFVHLQKAGSSLKKEKKMQKKDAEADSEPSQTSRIEPFQKIAKSSV